MSTTRWLSADEQQTWRAFLQMRQLIFDRFDRDLQRDSGIPLAYYEILVRLSESPQRRLRMSHLAESSLYSRSRISHAVTRLEALGWIRREPCSTDRRGLVAVLTEEGFTALHDAAPAHVQSVRRHLFDALGPEQVAELGRISARVVEHLDQTVQARSARPG